MPIQPTRRPPVLIRYHGGKYRIAAWIIEKFPPHRRYVEPFGGAASVLLQKPRAYSEVYNDLDADVVNLFEVLRDRAKSQQLIELLALTPYARDEFYRAWEPAIDSVERARRLVVRAQMGFGSAGATKGTTGFRSDSTRTGGLAAHTWARTYPDSLSLLCERLQGVIIENRCALEVMGQHDSADTLHFVDPPYLPTTRTTRGGYRHELTVADHEALLAHVTGLTGMVAISGYDSPLYNDALKGWARHESQSRASGNRGTVMRTEVLWCNPALQAESQQTTQSLIE